jgi:hypothetical protein
MYVSALFLSVVVMIHSFNLNDLHTCISTSSIGDYFLNRAFTNKI